MLFYRPFSDTGLLNLAVNFPSGGLNPPQMRVNLKTFKQALEVGQKKIV